MIRVSSIDKDYSPAIGGFEDFGKLVIKGETDSRLDKGIDVMKEMLVAIKDVNKTLVDMNSSLGGKIDQLSDHLGGKMDRMLGKQDELLVEVKEKAGCPSGRGQRDKPEAG